MIYENIICENIIFRAITNFFLQKYFKFENLVLESRKQSGFIVILKLILIGYWFLKINKKKNVIKLFFFNNKNYFYP